MKKVLLVLFCAIIVVTLSSCNNANDQIDNTRDKLSEASTIDQTDLCLQIDNSISANEIDKAVSLSSQLVIPLTEEERSIIFNALTQRINNRIPVFTKSFGSIECLISQEIISEVNKYKEIVYNARVSSSANTNIVDYLNQVNSLKEYSKYNDYWAYYYAITDDLNKANQYWNYACDSYTDYSKEQHLTKSRYYFNKCLLATYDYDFNSFGIYEAQEFFQLYIDKIDYYFSTGKDLSLDYNILSDYERVTEELTNKGREFVDKIEALPTRVYYDL